MSDQASSSLRADAGTFASLLASFTSSAPRTNLAWDDSALADDVATISYEQALRSHRRVPSPASQPSALPFQAASAAPAVTATKTRKTASITIRLSEAEQTQLHERAAAAQLSVSAYLRSCIFEAEALRAQVKEALSQIRASAQADLPRQPQSRPASWRTRLLPHWRRPASA